MTCSVTMTAGDPMGQRCSCGHVDVIHAVRDGSVQCDVCSLLGNVVGPDDYLIIRSDHMTDEAADLMRKNISVNLPGLVGRVLIVETTRADVYVAKARPVQQADVPLVFQTYPGHDPSVTVGACRPSHPCPACVERLTDGHRHAEPPRRPPTSESGVSAGPDGRR